MRSVTMCIKERETLRTYGFGKANGPQTVEVHKKRNEFYRGDLFFFWIDLVVLELFIFHIVI